MTALEFWQTIWYMLLALFVAAFAVLDGYDLGMGVALPWVAKSGQEKRRLLRATSPYWDGNEAWLLVAVGCLFVTFPKVYTEIMSGLFPAVVLFMAALVARIAAVEFLLRSTHGRTAWVWTYFAGSLVILVLGGLLLGSLLSGMRLDPDQRLRDGVLGLAGFPQAVVALLVIAAAVLHAIAFAAGKVSDGFKSRLVHFGQRTWLAAGILALLTVVVVFAQHAPTLTRFTAWAGFVLMLIGLVGAGLMLDSGRTGFAYTSMFIVGIIVFLAGAQYPCLVRSGAADGLNLTIRNASSSARVLSTMLIAAGIAAPVLVFVSVRFNRAFRNNITEEGRGQ